MIDTSATIENVSRFFAIQLVKTSVGSVFFLPIYWQKEKPVWPCDIVCVCVRACVRACVRVWVCTAVLKVSSIKNYNFIMSDNQHSFCNQFIEIYVHKSSKATKSE